jgi:hypothetical protein
MAGKWHEPLCLLREPCSEPKEEHLFFWQRDHICFYCYAQCICERLKKLRAEERQLLCEDLGNLLRLMPSPDPRSQENIIWAEEWIKDLHKEADE